MAENPYVNKVEYAGQTTVTPSDVLNGKTFHDRSGAPQTGNLITHDVYDGLDSTSASDALSAKQGKVLNDSKASVSLSLSIQSVDLLAQQAGVYRYSQNCTNIPSSENGYCLVIERSDVTKLAIAITASGRYFTNTMTSGTWGGWIELALSDTVSNIAGLKSGTNNIGHVMCAGYNTGSGNYVDFFVPINTNGKNITSASIASNSAVYLSSKRVTFSSAPSVTVQGFTNYGVRLELQYPSTQTANICATVSAVDLSIVCS